MTMSMKAKVLWTFLIVAAVVLLVEFLVLDGFMPSISQQRTGQLRKENGIGMRDEDILRELRPKLSEKKTQMRSKSNKAALSQTGGGVATERKMLNSAKTGKLAVGKSVLTQVGDGDGAILEGKILSSAKPDSLKVRKRKQPLLDIKPRKSGEKQRKRRRKTKIKRRRPLLDRKLFLIYTELFGDFPWGGLSDSSQFTQFRNTPCPVTNCSLSYDKLDFSRSNVVMFHARDMPPAEKMEYLHKRRPRGQVWVYLVLENPINTADPEDLIGMFNWTVTYERSADVFLPYGSYERLLDNERSDVEEVNIAAKDRLVVWLVSNCGGIRDWYVEKLRNYLRVDVFGNCAQMMYQPELEEYDCPKGTWECDNLLKRYKFHLSLENGNCVDYVTEKYWGVPLELGIVPVVLGGANYKEIAIPGSYINILDFPSVQALADYLVYLDKNETAYMEYFAWRKKYKVRGYLKGNAFNAHYPWTCELCAKAQNPQTKVYGNLSEFRNPESLCGALDHNITEMIYSDSDMIYRNDSEEGVRPWPINTEQEDFRAFVAGTEVRPDAVGEDFGR